MHMFTHAGQAEAASRPTAGAVERCSCLDCNHAVHVPASRTVSELLTCVITAWRCTLFGPSFWYVHSHLFSCCHIKTAAFALLLVAGSYFGATM